MGPKCRRSRVATLVTPSRSRDRYDARISSTEWPVGVQLDELRHAFVVSDGDIYRYQIAYRKQSQERRFGFAAGPALNHVTDLCRDCGRHEELLSRCAEQLLAHLVVAIVGIASCHQGASVDQYHRPNSARRISSERSALWGSPPAVSWELNGSGAVTLTHNLPLTRDFVRREGIEPPTR
jgi:hypothetical protein